MHKILPCFKTFAFFVANPAPAANYLEASVGSEDQIFHNTERQKEEQVSEAACKSIPVFSLFLFNKDNFLYFSDGEIVRNSAKK